MNSDARRRVEWHQVQLDAVVPQPWRNGGGITRELLAWPDPGGWRVRVSVAEVAQSGPFSRFAGVERWFAVVCGAGVRLTVEAVPHVLTTDSAPLAFSGEADTGCELLTGPTRDLNLMTRAAPAVMRRIRGGEVRTVRGGTFVAVFALDVMRVLGADAPGLVPAGTLSWRLVPADQPQSMRLEGAHALWMEVTL